VGGSGDMGGSSRDTGLGVSAMDSVMGGFGLTNDTGGSGFNGSVFGGSCPSGKGRDAGVLGLALGSLLEDNGVMCGSSCTMVEAEAALVKARPLGNWSGDKVENSWDGLISHTEQTNESG
jgi:hypothetical protein